MVCLFPHHGVSFHRRGLARGLPFGRRCFFQVPLRDFHFCGFPSPGRGPFGLRCPGPFSSSFGICPARLSWWARFSCALASVLEGPMLNAACLFDRRLEHFTRTLLGPLGSGPRAKFGVPPLTRCNDLVISPLAFQVLVCPVFPCRQKYGLSFPPPVCPEFSKPPLLLGLPLKEVTNKR